MQRTQQVGDSTIDAVSFGGGKTCYQSPTAWSVWFGDYPNGTDVQAWVKCWVEWANESACLDFLSQIRTDFVGVGLAELQVRRG